MTEEEERAEFEAWYRETRRISRDQLFIDANGAALRLLFQAWQAGYRRAKLSLIEVTT